MEEQQSDYGLELHPGMNVWVRENGRHGQIQSIRIVSTGETTDSYSLTEAMEPLVLTLIGQGYSTKQLINRPGAVQLYHPSMERTIDDDLYLGGEREALDNETVYGDGADNEEKF